MEVIRVAHPDGTSPDGLELLRQVMREAGRVPATTVLTEFATVGPVLCALVGGRRGVPRHRAGVRRDEEVFIPLYRRTFAALLAEVPAGPHLMPLVDAAIAHDHRENAHLLAAFDLLDPPDDAPPRVAAATRHTAPAAIRAAAKFALLLPAVVPAGAGTARICARLRRRQVIALVRPG